MVVEVDLANGPTALGNPEGRGRGVYVRLVVVWATGEVVVVALLREGTADTGLAVGRVTIGFLPPNPGLNGLLVVGVVDEDTSSYSYSSVVEEGSLEEEDDSVEDEEEDSPDGVVPRVGIVGFENLLKLSGLPLVMFGLGVVLREELADPAVGVESLGLRRKRFEPPPYLLVVRGASVVACEEGPSTYSSSPMFSEFVVLAVGLTVVI